MHQREIGQGIATLDGEVRKGFPERVLLEVIGRCLLGLDIYIWALQSLTLSTTPEVGLDFPPAPCLLWPALETSPILVVFQKLTQFPIGWKIFQSA